MADQHTTVVIGGGWSGLAAAIELSRHQRAVQLLESARQLGGRARRVPFDNATLDNGQHLLIGAYRDTLQLLNTIGLDPELKDGCGRRLGPFIDDGSRQLHLAIVHRRHHSFGIAEVSRHALPQVKHGIRADA